MRSAKAAKARTSVSRKAAVLGLQRYLLRTSYMRKPNMARRRAERSRYKKGPEVRFVVYSSTELAEVRRLLRRLDLSPGRPYPKHSQTVLPLYGTEQVQRLLSLVGISMDASPIPPA